MPDKTQTTDWQPIATAPRDGCPVWARGRDYGRNTQPYHCVWAYWDGGEWKAAGVDGSTLIYLAEWKPT